MCGAVYEIVWVLFILVAIKPNIMNKYFFEGFVDEENEPSVDECNEDFT